MIDNKTKYELIWPFIKNGAIQRAKLKSGISKEIKVYLRENIFLKYYQRSISEKELWDNLKHLTKWSTNHNKEFFGNAQKFINLTLKSMWLADWLYTPPPHFPVDRIIQRVINTGRKYHDPYTWTNMRRDEYEVIIKAPKKYSRYDDYQIIAQKDLALWEVTTYYNLLNS